MMRTHLVIPSAEYTLDIRLKPLARGRRHAVVSVSHAADWAVPFEVKFEIPDEGDALREMIAYARQGRFRAWLGKHGYDQYGRGAGTYGRL